ncbi:MAG: aminopeptidase P family N-terminal domain-containing protein, partial [Bacteroidales bacterium]|nr:aminopeptidase P family N-terminal domain-containing protein [Bacteroidales bacterium]
MYDKQALDNLRKWLQEHYFQGIVIPSNDCHFDEYVPERFAVRAAVSGFDGSAGTLVVTNCKAALWTDSRYFLQAARQLQGTGIELMKLKMAGTPAIAGWLKSELSEGSRIAVDGNLFSQGEFDTLSGDIAPYELCAIDDPFDDILQSRPAMPAAPIYIIDERYSGESVVSKRQRLIAKATLEGSFAFVISTTDDIMWLCNIRGGDIEYNSVALSYCVVTSDGLHLFCNLPCLEQSAAQYLASQGVTLHEYDTFRQFLGDLKVDKVMFSSNLATVQTYSAVPKGIEVVKDPIIGGVLPMLKCRKNA